MSFRIAVDAMGGDNAPSAIVRGALRALAGDSEIELILVGDADRIGSELSSVPFGGVPGVVSVVHADEVIGMDESPVEALRAKKDSSLVKMVSLAAGGEADAVVSAGNTGACAAACQLRLKPLPCVSRPGIAVTVPSFHGPFVLCDVGANIRARPTHLHEYAIMASVYAERVIGITDPRVALMSIGEESTKGTGLIRRTHELLSGEDSVNFVGNAEGRELFENRCDVAICDGFVGNIVLKFVEGLAEGLFRTIAREFDDEAPHLRDRFRGALKKVQDRHDYSEYGGAPLLGIDGVCVICHGRSNDVAICNAVKTAKRFVSEGFNEAISARLT